MTAHPDIVVIAKAIDPEAWRAIDDGRDALPDSLWHIRRQFACDKAKAAWACALDILSDQKTQLVKVWNGGVIQFVPTQLPEGICDWQEELNAKRRELGLEVKT